MTTKSSQDIEPYHVDLPCTIEWTDSKGLKPKSGSLKLLNNKKVKLVTNDELPNVTDKVLVSLLDGSEMTFTAEVLRVDHNVKSKCIHAETLTIKSKNELIKACEEYVKTVQQNLNMEIDDYLETEGEDVYNVVGKFRKTNFVRIS